MGYEVLDSGGNRPTGSGASSGGSSSSGAEPTSHPLDVVDLDAADLGEPRDGAEREPQQGPIGRLTRSLEQAPPTLRRVLAGGLAAAVCGALVGGVAVRRYDDAQASRADRAVLSAGASVSDIAAGTQFRTSVVELRLQAQISNYGPLPIRVLTGQSLPSLPTIDVTGPSPQVAPGRQALLEVTLTVDCSSLPSDRPVVVPVLTPDQRRHEVPLRGVDDAVLATYCTGVQQTVQVRVTGTLEQPRLEISNTGPRDLNFTLTSEEVPGDGPGGPPLLTLTTDPTAPVTVGARGKRSVALRLTAQRCVRDVAKLPSGIYLLVEGRGPADNAVVATSGADLVALTGAAVARACAG